MKIVIPIRTVSEANAHEHWRARQKRAKAQRGAALLASRSPAIVPLRLRLVAGLPLVVTLTRVAPRPLDSDNAVGAMKHLRDGVADALGIDDRSPLIAWLYRQRKGEPNQYAVEIEIDRLEVEQVEASP